VRVGHDRIVFEVHDDHHIVYIVGVGHRDRICQDSRRRRI
jgi:mRNA-degrading endonuclease RelE of RelBE toxin-antitoxin system